MVSNFKKMGKKAETIRVVCPMCLQEFPGMKENDFTPRHLHENKECKGTHRLLEQVVSVRSNILGYNN